MTANRRLCALQTLLILASLIGALSASAQTICIDPGHSRKTVGTSGKRISEYRLCFKIAVALKRELENRGMKVILTKDSVNLHVSNRERAEIANRARADLFLRLHCDADPQRGMATFYPAKQGKKEGKIGPSPAVIRASHAAARRFHDAAILALEGGLKDRGLRTDMQTAVGRKLGGALEGSIYSQVPVVLSEMCVLTQAKDENFVLSKEGERRLVKALAAGAEAATKQTPTEKKEPKETP